MAGWDNDLLPPITVELERMADLLTPPVVMPLVFRRLELAREDGMRGVSCRSELFNISLKISNCKYTRLNVDRGGATKIIKQIDDQKDRWTDN